MATYVREFPAKRIVQQIGGGKVTKRLRENLKRETKTLAEQISSDAPVKTGELERSVKVKFIGGPNPRMKVTTVEHGLYQNEGTRTGIKAKRFVEKSMVQGRSDWEGRVRDRSKI